MREDCFVSESQGADMAITRVPRTRDEEARLLEAQPGGWEYLLWGAVLLRKRNDLEPKWREHEARHRRPSDVELTESEALDRVSRVFDGAQGIAQGITGQLTPEAQERAFGRPGEPGNPELIAGSAAGIVAGYDELLEWSAGLRADGVPDRFRAIFDLASEFADLPLRQMREFIDRVVEQFDDIPSALKEDRPIRLELTLTLAVDEDVAARFQRELDETSERFRSEGWVLDDPAGTSREIVLVPASEGLEPAPGKQGGFFAARRAKKAEKQYRSDLAAWQVGRDACASDLARAKTFNGESSSTAMVLKRGEALFATVSGVALIEDRRGPGQWKGRSSGVSIPLGGGVRYRTGGSRGQYVQGASIPTAIDTGTMFITNKRVIFQGQKQTRECLFDKLVGFQHTTDGATIFSVSNRQKPTVIHYGAALSGWLDFQLDLALAHHREDVSAIVAQLEADLAALDASKPSPPAST
jgi:hypothetical protein